ncbi:MAG: metallophosphoesterase family protein [Chloroflexi bacterium]|nr:metallophosphoesterase family protein [Chloroflexota bacterium]
MRYAILGDIHGNLEAFQAVLADIQSKGGVDGFWCLGDTVGYGPDPNECVRLVRSGGYLAVAGNHDLAAVGKIDIADFNPEAAEAAKWTNRQLSGENADYLSGLPERLVTGDFTMVHGSPRQPVWEYLLSAGVARENMRYFSTPYCLIGHSHVPLFFELEGERCYLRDFPEKSLLELGSNRLIINPGSVGQPRDGDRRASYLIYDEDKREIRHFRVPYDIAAAQKKMLAGGLPERLAERLSYGM